MNAQRKSAFQLNQKIDALNLHTYDYRNTRSKRAETQWWIAYSQVSDLKTQLSMETAVSFSDIWNQLNRLSELFREFVDTNQSLHADLSTIEQERMDIISERIIN